MFDFIWHSVAAQIGLGSALIAGLLAAAYFLPPFRKWFLGAAGIVLAFLLAYAKGARDNAKAEQVKKEKAVKKARDSYDKIDARTDDDRTVAERLRKHDF